MSEVKSVATRVGFGTALKELGHMRDDFIVMDADLAAATQTGAFKKEFPDRVPLQELHRRYRLTPEQIIDDIKNII